MIDDKYNTWLAGSNLIHGKIHGQNLRNLWHFMLLISLLQYTAYE